MVLIPMGVSYTAKAWGGTVKHVTCAHCATQYVYEMRRLVSGESSAPLFLGTGGAKRRAVVGAEAQLLRTLSTDHDLIPCPNCHRLQPEMLRLIRRRWITWMIVAWAAFLIVDFFRYMMIISDNRVAPAWLFWLPVALTVVLLAAMIAVFKREFRSIATDRAQLENEAAAQGYARLGMPRVLGDGWIWVRATLFKAPPICAGCGGEPSQEVGRPLGSLGVGAFVCRKCFWRAKRRRFAWGALCFLGPMVLAQWFVLRDPWWDWTGVLFAIFWGGALGVAMLAIVNNWWLGRAGMPVRFRRYRAYQDTVEVRFRSSKATEEFLAEALHRMLARVNAEQTTGPGTSPA